MFKKFFFEIIHYIFETHVLTFFSIFEILKMFCNNLATILTTHVHTLNKKKCYFFSAHDQKKIKGADLVLKKGRNFW